jgi:uncharacterized protein YndB with AHSA1/START domain
MENKIIFNKDDNSATFYIMKVFNVEVSEVWNHFTKAELIDQWWAPNPWKCKTLNMDFTPEGFWNYAMISPENEKNFSGVQFHEINFHRSFDYSAFFTDANGNINKKLSSSNWLLGFTGVEEGTKLTVNIHFKTTDDMTAILEMGFEDGFKMGLNQLENLLNKKD